MLLLTSCAQTNQVNNANADTKLSALIDEYEQYERSTNVFKAKQSDSSSFLLPDLSPATLAAHYQKRLALYKKLTKIGETSLSEDNQINYVIFYHALKNKLDSYRYNSHFTPLMAESGFHASIASRINNQRLTSVQDYQTHIARLSQLDRYFDQQMYWMQQGLEQGYSLPKVVMTGFEQSILAYIPKNVSDSSFYQPFKQLPDSIPTKVQQQLKAKAHEVISSTVVPSYQRFFDFMTKQYMPKARTTIAAHDLPNGEGFYQNRTAHYTTTAKSVDEIHQIGLTEVARIKADMHKILERLNYQGSLAEFIQFLRTDPQFYAKTPEELLMRASYIAKNIDGKLPSMFKHLPRIPYGIIPVPKEIAPKYTTGRYQGSSRDDKAGFYWVNTYALDRRPLYVLPALTLHEAVPGHHLQNALAQELTDVPTFRRNYYISAFGEGWALYTEWLGIEMGIYSDDYSDFGRLTYEMWRACRLVVDTGMHAKGWTRQQAINYLSDNTALSLHNVVTEIDRYISWPGQALSYKMGELTIKSLRQEAEMALGEAFDVREFHQQILRYGSIPLSLLEQKTRQYIKNKKAGMLEKG